MFHHKEPTLSLRVYLILGLATYPTLPLGAKDLK